MTFFSRTHRGSHLLGIALSIVLWLDSRDGRIDFFDDSRNLIAVGAIAKTTSKSKRKDEDENDPYDELVRDVNSNQFRMVNVGELVRLTTLPEERVAELRALATKDALTDPWSETKYTSPLRFFDWYWGKRIELEQKFIVDKGVVKERAK